LNHAYIYLSLGLERNFDPAVPLWQKYVHGLLRGGDKVDWTYSFYRVLRKYLNQNPMNCEQFDNIKFRDLCKKQYLRRQAQLPPKVAENAFGCFSYTLWPEDRVRLHFHNAETDYCALGSIR